jgi:hypothetical protein
MTDSNVGKKRANAVIKTQVEGDGPDARMVFAVLGAGTLTLEMGKLSAAVLARAALHGMKQRVSDAAAIPCDRETGRPATPEEKFAAMKELVDHYMTGTGEWNRARAAGSGGGRDTSGITLQAMRRVWPDRDCEELVFKLERRRVITRREAYAAFAKTREVAAMIAQIKSEGANMSADDLLFEMEEED